MRCVLFGPFGMGDAGEDAVVRCMVRALRARASDASIAVASFAPHAHDDLRIDVLDARDDGALGSVVAAADLVVIAGGTCWDAAAAWNPADVAATAFAAPAFHPARPLLMAAAAGVRSALFANAFVPLPTPDARRAVAALAALAAHVSVRDHESANALRAAGFTGAVVVTADPTFALEPDAACDPAPSRRPIRIGVVATAATPTPIAAALQAVGAHRPLEVLLLPTLGSGDRAGDGAALAAELGRVCEEVVVVTPASATEAARWLATCTAVVTSRLHGQILAAVAGTPAVTVGDDPALQSHARLLGCADLAVEPGAVTPQAIETRIERILRSRDAIANEVVARVAAARGVLDGGYDALVATAATTGGDRHASELATYERINARLRARLEEREESLRTLAGFLGQSVEKVAPASSGVSQGTRDLQVLRGRVEAAEAELETIKRSRGWRLLHRYGRFKHHWLFPALRAVRSFGRGGDTGASAAIAADEPAVLGLVPPGAHDVVCFPIIDWDFRYQRPQHLMSRFAAAGHRVFYVAPQFVAPYTASVVAEKAPNIYHVTLAGLPRSVWSQALDAKALEPLFASLDRLRVEYGLGATLTCVQQPFWWPLAAAARDRFAWPIVYDCMDDHAGFETHTGATDRDEDALFTDSDLVVASSALLLERARRYTDRPLLVRNGCEYDHFAAAAAPRARPTGAAGAMRARPIIGFYGAIANWFDGDLVADVAERRPDWDFVLVGSTYLGDVTRLAKLPNVRLPGEQPYADIPHWLADFDVTLLPFKRSPLTEAANPVKAYEILAAGKPIVSVPLPEMMDMHERGLVRLATTPAEFEREIAASLAHEDEGLLEARRAYARANTWEARYETLAAAVPALFPKASTVIVTYGNLALTQACLASIFERTEWPHHEIIVVDNASTDGTPEYLRRLAAERSDVVVICNETNVGFAAACNQGLARATGDYLVLLNNDTVVTRGWLAGLIRHLHAVPEIGLIGPVTNEIGNEAKIEVGYDGLDAMPAWAARYTGEHHDELRGMHMLAMFCVAMRRDVFAEVGPLDERFGIGMFEDDDYARRVHQLGYRTVCASDVFVHHVGGASFKRLDSEAYRVLFARNKRLYEEKWGLWAPHQDRSVAPRVDRLAARLGAIVEAAGVGADRVIVFLRPGAEPAPGAARTQRLAAALAAEGMLVFVHAASDADGDGFRMLAPNLWSYSGPAGTLERLEAPVLWATTDNALHAFRWLTRRVVYDVSADPTALPARRENHERMLREASVVVCASQTCMDELRARRADAVYLPDGGTAGDGAGSWQACARAVVALLRTPTADDGERLSAALP